MNMFMDPLGQLYSALSTRETGLTTAEVEKKQMTFGLNALPEKKKEWFKLLINEFNSPLVFILLGAVVLLFALPIIETGHIAGHDLIEPLAIIFILIFNGLLGFFQSMKAENTLEALKTLQPTFSSVMRDGNVIQIRSEELVPGDIILLSEGEKIPADIRLIQAVSCTTNESLLTGESTPIEKKAIISREENGENILFSGSDILSGRAKGVVIKTGLETSIGQIASMISEIKRPPSPMQKKLERLAKKIGIGMIALCVIVFGISLLRDIYWVDALFTAIALAVAAVPEGLPTIMTISLAIGVSVMARKNALVRDLKSVEALGSITVIASDKTGTITQNKMSAEEIYSDGKFLEKKNFGEDLDIRLLEIIKHCNDATLPNIGDPTEIALLELADTYEVKNYERIDEVPFSSDTKWMSTTHEIDGEEIIFFKGAPEVIAQKCDPSLQKEIIDASIQLAEKGIRTLGAGYMKKGDKYVMFSGIIGLQDPPRETVEQAIITAQKAGIRTLMITGDHAITAKAIAKKVGIISEVKIGKEIENASDAQLREWVETISVFARVTPHHKVRICQALQANGEIVAMTGDGVNDAPAITQAEVGISMGKVGTSVARNASDMVLMDDDYSTIVKGIKEGRRIFANIKKALVFLIATNLAEVLVLMMALIIGLPLPLLPLHILFINLLTDSFPALALATEPAEEDIMNQKPRPATEGFFTGSLGLMSFLGVIVSGLVLALFAYSLSSGVSLAQSQTFAFAALGFFEIGVILSLRTHEPLWAFASFNKWIYMAIIGVIILTLLAIYTPASVIFGFEAFPLMQWVWIGVGMIAVILALEVFKKFSHRW